MAKSEIQLERKISAVQMELQTEIGRIGGEIKSRPSYSVFITTLLSAVIVIALAIAAIFVPIIPTYTENVVTHKNEELKKSILSELEKYVDDKIAGLRKKTKP